MLMSSIKEMVRSRRYSIDDSSPKLPSKAVLASNLYEDAAAIIHARPWSETERAELNKVLDIILKLRDMVSV